MPEQLNPEKIHPDLGENVLDLAPFLDPDLPGETTRLDGERAFDTMKAAFDAAAAKHGVSHESTNMLGGYPMRLRIVGDDLTTKIARPMAHLEDTSRSGESRDLTFELWDEAETGIGCPEIQINEDIGQAALFTTSPDGRFIGYQRERSYLLYDRKRSHMLCWSKYEGIINPDERAKPHRYALAFWLGDHGQQVIHAGLVNHDGIGVMFTGKGGQGKSTSSICCLKDGLKYLSDDNVSLQSNNDGTFTGHSLFNSTRIAPHHIERFPFLLPHAIAGRPDLLEFDNKSVVILNEVFPGQFLKSSPIHAIMLPQVVDQEETTFRPATRAEALIAVAPTTILVIPGRARIGFEQLTELCSTLPCYWLELGRDLDSIPRAVRRMIEEIKQNQA